MTPLKFSSCCFGDQFYIFKRCAYYLDFGFFFLDYSEATALISIRHSVVLWVSVSIDPCHDSRFQNEQRSFAPLCDLLLIIRFGIIYTSIHVWIPFTCRSNLSNLFSIHARVVIRLHDDKSKTKTPLRWRVLILKLLKKIIYSLSCLLNDKSDCRG